MTHVGSSMRAIEPKASARVALSETSGASTLCCQRLGTPMRVSTSESHRRWAVVVVVGGGGDAAGAAACTVVGSPTSWRLREASRSG